MGIHDRLDPNSRVIQLSELNTGSVLSDIYTSDENSSVSSEQPVVSAAAVRRQKTRARDYQSLTERLYCKSRRLARRQHHLSLVRSLIGLEEADEAEDEGLCSPDYGRSAFSTLFTDGESMRVWSSFTQLSERDQQLCLLRHLADIDDGCGSSKESCVEWQRVDMVPAPETCFQRISSRRSRALLNRRHLPLGLLERLEMEIRSCFYQSPPDTISRPDVTSTFERLLVHAIAQYLDLHAFSRGDQDDTTRSLVIVNKQSSFSPPVELLCEYLEQQWQRKHCNLPR